MAPSEGFGGAAKQAPPSSPEVDKELFNSSVPLQSVLPGRQGPATPTTAKKSGKQRHVAKEEKKESDEQLTNSEFVCIGCERSFKSLRVSPSHVRIVQPAVPLPTACASFVALRFFYSLSHVPLPWVPTCFFSRALSFTRGHIDVLV